jgi:hypothetical protein
VVISDSGQVGIAVDHLLWGIILRMTNRLRFTATVLAAFLLALIPSSGSGAQSQNPPMSDSPTDESKVVYVCACLKTKSCPCMTEAKMEGPCACGTHGGPPLKAVPKNSDWAKENRKALAK